MFRVEGSKGLGSGLVGAFLAAHGEMPLVGVEVVPRRRCATLGGPPGFLCRSTRDGSHEEGRRLWSASSEPSPLSRPGSLTRAKHTVSAQR